MSSSNSITSPTLSATGGSATVTPSGTSSATSSTPTPPQPTSSGSNPFGGNNDNNNINNNNNNTNGGSTPLSVFMTLRHSRRQTSGNSSLSAQSPSDSTASSSSSSSSSSTTSTSPTSTSSSSNDGSNGGGGGGTSGLWSPGTNFPVPFLAFAVVAIALFVVVVAFVLLRICMRNRRLRRMGILPDGPFDRFLGGGPMGLREVEDTQVPPRLWEAKIVPISAYSQDTHYRPGTGQYQDSSTLWGGRPTNERAPAAPGAPSLPQGWANLMPIAASLPSNLYTATGAQKMLSALEDDKKEADTDAADASERIPGSVNVSVFIAMPSPPKQDGEELPELMIGTAAVPIFSRPTTAHADAPTTPAAPNGEYFGEQQDATPPATANKQFSHPTRAELLALYKLAREVKGAKANKRQEAATNAAATAGTTSTEEDAAGGENTAVHPSSNVATTHANA